MYVSLNTPQDHITFPWQKQWKFLRQQYIRWKCYGFSISHYDSVKVERLKGFICSLAIPSIISHVPQMLISDYSIIGSLPETESII